MQPSAIKVPENFEVKQGEEMFYHIVQEQLMFNSRTGLKESKSRMQKYGIKEWNAVRKSLIGQEYSYVVAHDPVEWMKKNADRIEKERIERENAKSEAAKKALEEAAAKKQKEEDERIAKLVAEQVAQQMAILNQKKETVHESESIQQEEQPKPKPEKAAKPKPENQGKQTEEQGE